MLCQDWEPYAERLANTNDEQLWDVVTEIAKAEKIQFTSQASLVVVGMDTRPHSEMLKQCIKEGVAAFNGTVHDLGIVTTPQLHFIVQHTNRENDKSKGVLELKTYYEVMSQFYLELIATSTSKPVSKIIIDASNGVGSIAIDELRKIAKLSEQLEIEVRNPAYSGPVNEGCGAELVQKKQIEPRGFKMDTDQNQWLCSFDGDADRVVFHTWLENGTWVLLDGDKIAVIFVIFLFQELKAAGLAETFSLGLIQTAYANGASTQYLQKHYEGIQIAIAKTGVKFLHHKALDYDVGVYFEANGHGTVLFSEKAQEHITNLFHSITDEGSPKKMKSDSDMADRKKLAIRRLYYSIKLINQATGDAVSDMLFILAATQVRLPLHF